MTFARYTRYTLRLGEGAAVAPQAQSPSAWADDWSGAPPPAAPDPAALEYRHPEAVALLRDLGVGWEEQDGGDTLVFWLPEGEEREQPISSALARLAARGRLRAEPEPPGWEEAWKAFHEAQTVGRLWVRPPWSPPRTGLLDVVIEAGMAFGTGGHPTTRQCLAELQTIAPGSLLDVGSGSGVVALAACRLGFAPVWGVDIDPVAIAASVDNAERNGLAAVFSLGDATDEASALPGAETVVANLALAPIVRLARRFVPGGGAPSVLRPRRLILAGLLVSQRVEALAAYPGYEQAAARDDGEWLMLRLEPAA